MVFYHSKAINTRRNLCWEEVEAWPSSCRLALLGTGFIQCVLMRPLNSFSFCLLTPLLQTWSLVELAVFLLANDSNRCRALVSAWRALGGYAQSPRFPS